MNTKCTFVLGMFVAIAGCSQPHGTLEVAVSGERAAVDGWSADAFADGWSIAFDRVLVSIADVRVRARDGADADLAFEPIIVDLHAGPRTIWRRDGVAARRWDDVGYTIAPPPAEARLDPAVRPEDAARLIEQRRSFVLEGTARHGTHGTVAFSIETSDALVSRACQNEDGTDGIVVPEGGTGALELTLHLDHPFFDSFTDEARMRFDAWAAVAGDDGIVTLDDLASQMLADLRGLDGMPLRDPDGTPVFYDPGSTPLESLDLASFVRALIARIGHLNGEGHCAYGASP